MSIIGVIIFFAGWIYAMGEFGLFLGLGVGWFPALFVAFILDFVIVMGLGLLGIALRVIIGKRR